MARRSTSPKPRRCRIRGALVSTYQLAITIGILVSYLTGLLVSGDGTWRTLFGLGAVPGLLFLAGLAFLPESPRWLVLKGFPDEARASLRRLRAEGWNVDGELAEMVRTAEAATGRKTGYRALLEPAIRPALIVAVGLFFLQQLSGINAVIYYAPEIFAPCRLRQRNHADAGDGRGRNGQSADHRAGDVS